MKKVILSALVVSSLLATSCKKAKEAGNGLTEGATTVVEGAAGAVEGAADAVVEGAEGAAGAVAEGAEGVADAVKSAVGAGLEGVEIPDFKDPKVKEYLVEYSAFAKEYVAEGADVAKNADLMKKSTELATKASEVVKGLDAESVQKFGKVMSAIAAKMAPAAK